MVKPRCSVYCYNVVSNIFPDDIILFFVTYQAFNKHSLKHCLKTSTHNIGSIVDKRSRCVNIIRTTLVSFAKRVVVQSDHLIRDGHNYGILVLNSTELECAFEGVGSDSYNSLFIAA